MNLQPAWEPPDQLWAGEVLAALLEVEHAGSRRFELTEEAALTRAEHSTVVDLPPWVG